MILGQSSIPPGSSKEGLMKETIQFQLNGQPIRVTVDSNRMLLWVLRTELGLTGTKYGCGEALCGACTVLIDGEAMRSCTVPLRAVAGSEVVTIEGLAQNGKLHPLQEAFVEHNALQCGFCTPGMILTAYSLLKSKPNPNRHEIIDYMEDNLCRCGAHNRIIQAIQTASRIMEGA
jgi:aerobic-type carbon monoxide dehydrogenase small subunit (CoxS/CutS family)